MKKKVQEIISHPLFSGSAVMIVGSNLANFFAFVYHFVMGRLLSVQEYGDLAAVIAFLSFDFAIFSFLGLLIPKYVASAKDKNEEKNIISWFFRKAFLAGIVGMIVIILFSSVLTRFLNMSGHTLYLVGPIFLFSLLIFIFKSALQGMLKFGKMTIASNLELGGRLIVGVIFAYLGFGVLGAVGGILVTNILVFAALYVSLRKYLNSDKSKWQGRGILNYALPTFIYSVSTTLFMTSDVFLAKHFLTGFDAGLYASLSTIGKIILYGTGPVGLVMFPLIAKKVAQGKKFVNLFVLSMFLVLGLSMVGLTAFVAFPQVIIGILYGEKYLLGSTYLVWFSLYAALLSIAMLICQFMLSINKTKVVVLPCIFAFVQITAVYLYHTNVEEIVKASVLSVSFLTLALVTYVGYELSAQANKGK